ncbi:hypothetical protein ND861_07125 [Leptospira sp. 2 VSF19]|uniref:Uncharacterized protein n=1 Tax=Leptospira soteropolitanensis TaxID=2950025 RepID=A0AAW5VA30_9LEPT|nr:hypothetical protein [Leptospira soteropolitanensis]MCW7494664.1 hypothetical protein [Leptospira soteropolitanensis]MCW7500002.1 hypothetical protein [Leptospira soteropolitanensis]MCW7522253.1 hypothetical protein [Leptospira soteropolitanensis]MCW7526109.1 hypothetical protein [Leptospira soteropolitanensis]MCW7529779.1 hypothetical protein [Leptospira soteropolitanensis]
MKHLMGSFIHVLEGHHEDELVTEEYAKAKGFYKIQIDNYLASEVVKVDENGIKYYWKSIVDFTYELDFVQDEIDDIRKFIYRKYIEPRWKEKKKTA